MDFARLWEQAKDLWSRPIGKVLLGSIAAFLVVAVVASYLWSRPTYVALGTFEASVAPQVAKKLNDSKIPFKNENFTFSVDQNRYDEARLALAELPIDPTNAAWGGFDSWKGKTSWSDTDFDKRRLWEEQTENNLAGTIKKLSVVDQARVDISVPTTEPLFKEQETPPKATVVVLPKKGQTLTTPMVEAMMELVAGAVDKLDRGSVVVIDSSTSKVVSADAFKEKAPAAQAAGDESNVQLAVLKQYQDRWTELLTVQLEKVAGAGNVSVLVNPIINWDRVQEELQEYTPTGAGGKGVVLSEQTKTATAEGTQAATAGPGSTGTTPNAEVSVPGYPGAVTSPGGNLSQESVEKITNYLVSGTKRITEKPGGSIESLSVGLFLNAKTIDAQTEQAMKSVITTAMGGKAQVELAAVPFAPSLWDDLKNQPGTTGPVTSGTPVLLYALLAVFLTLGVIAFGLLAFRPRRPVLEPVFAGPEAAMMGGIPVSDLEMQSAADAYASQVAMATGTPGAAPGGPSAASLLEGEVPDEDAEPLAPEELGLLGDDFLQKLGVDPAKVRMKEKVEKIAKANPEAVASLLKTWISDG